MKLDEYVKQTLLDITNGVTEAQKQTKLYIAPGLVENERQSAPQYVKFEISVTINSEAGGGIRVWSIGDAKAQAASEHTNRLAFEVPVYFQAPTEANEKHFSHRKQIGEGENE